MQSNSLPNKKTDLEKIVSMVIKGVPTQKVLDLLTRDNLSDKVTLNDISYPGITALLKVITDYPRFSPMLKPILEKVGKLFGLTSGDQLTAEKLAKNEVLKKIWETVRVHCRRGNFEKVKLFLEASPYLRNSVNLVHEDNSLLLEAVSFSANARALKLNDQSKHEQLVQNKLAIIAFLLNCKAFVDITGYINATPLCVASTLGELSIVKLLVENGANVNHQCETGSPILLALNENEFAVVGYLLENNADINSVMEYGTTMLHAACAAGNLSAVKFLIENGANINAETDNGVTSLNQACFHGYYDIARYLIERGANFDAKTADKDTCFHVACQGGNLDLVKFLLTKGADAKAINVDGKTSIYFLAANSDSSKDAAHLEILELLIDQGVDFKAADNMGFTPLYIACQNNHLALAAKLIELGADVNQTNNAGYPPLYLVCSEPNLAIVKLLIENGADINKTGDEDDTPFLVACQAGSLEIINLFLQSKHANQLVNFSNKDKYTPLHLAVREGHSEIVKVLIGAGANILQQGKAGKTALHIALSGKNDAIIMHLLLHCKRNKLNLNVVDDYGNNLLHVAAKKNQKTFIAALVTSETINTKNNAGETPLCLACEYGNLECIKILIENGANIYSALDRARHYSKEVIKLLNAAKVLKDVEKKKKQNKKKQERRKRKEEEKALLTQEMESKKDDDKTSTSGADLSATNDVSTTTTSATKEIEKPNEPDKMMVSDTAATITSSRYSLLKSKGWSESAIARMIDLEVRRKEKSPEEEKKIEITLNIKRDISELDLVWGGERGLNSKMPAIKTVFNTPTDQPNIGFYCPPDLLKAYPEFHELITSALTTTGMKFARAFSDQGLKPLKGAKNIPPITVQVGNTTNTYHITHEFKTKHKHLGNDRLFVVSIPADNNDGQVYIVVYAGKALHVDGAIDALKKFASHAGIIDVSLPTKALDGKEEFHFSPSKSTPF